MIAQFHLKVILRYHPIGSHSFGRDISPPHGQNTLYLHDELFHSNQDGVISNFTPVCNGSTSNLNETHLVNCSFEPNFVKSGIYYVMSKAWSV